MKLKKYLCHVLTIKDTCQMMEFICWLIFITIVLQVVKRFKNFVIRKKRLKKIVIKKKRFKKNCDKEDCEKRHVSNKMTFLIFFFFSSNINEVIRAISYSFFTKRFYKHKKHKKHKKYKTQTSE